MGVVDPAEPAWDRLAAEEKRLREEIDRASDRRTRRELKRELRTAQQKTILEAGRLRSEGPPATH